MLVIISFGWSIGFIILLIIILLIELMVSLNTGITQYDFENIKTLADIYEYKGWHDSRVSVSLSLR